MGNSYISKETFHPNEDAFVNAIIHIEGKENIDLQTAEQLKLEKPLKINADDKLNMVVEETGLEWPRGTALYKMKNKKTHTKGLVASNMVAKAGTIDLEK